MFKRLEEYINSKSDNRLTRRLSDRSPKQIFMSVVMLYIFVILVVSVLFLVGRMNIVEVAITFALLLLAFIPIFKNN
mgnify:CR=1 FL=1